MKRKIIAVLLMVCMLASILPVFTGFANEESDYYQLIASDTLYASAYGVANNTTYANITNLNYGTGWSDVWSKFSKLDSFGMFTGRPSATANKRVKRMLAKEIDFGVEGTYTFTAELRDETLQTQNFRFELGDSGIVFGADVPNDLYWRPQLQLPNGSMTVYSDETSDSLKATKNKSMFIILEVTANNDGEDTLKVKVYTQGTTSPVWLMTETAEISNKKISYVNTGFNYCTGYTNPTGVSRIRSIKIEFANFNTNIIKELAYAYDRQGAQIPYDQYYSRRSIYSSPEDATAQRTIFLDCSSFINSCYREAFGVNVLPYEISDATGTSPHTAYFDSYAKNNPDAVDVLGYWEPAEYTDDEKKDVVEYIYDNLRIGDVVVYRHGATSGTKGHVYMYMGSDTFIHCAGAGSYVMNESNPALSYDSDASEITSKGTIGTVSADSIFKNTTHSRYIFRVTESDTVWSFAILRPMARGLTPTQETLNRMKIAGLSMEKISSVCENAAVDTGDILTYTVTLENTNEYALSNVSITDTLPEGTEYISGDDGVTVTGSSLVWQGDVPGKSTLNVNYMDMSNIAERNGRCKC